MRIAAHVCRGNFRSSWIAEGGYDYVAEELFGGLDVDAFFCEFDDERSGGFAPLRFVPPGKQVVLGLVTTKRGRMEDADELKRRIDEAASYVPLDQLCLSPQCGFSSTVEGNVLNPHDRFIIPFSVLGKKRLVATMHATSNRNEIHAQHSRLGG